LIFDPPTTGPFSPPVTQAVAESDRRESLADLRRPVIENQLSDPSNSELTTMAPMMAMMVELQKEIGELDVIVTEIFRQIRMTVKLTRGLPLWSTFTLL
jgi:hypothetical protein